MFTNVCVCSLFPPQSIESRLKIDLPEDLGSSLMDGVVLCHLANHIRPRSVGSIHVPSPAVVRQPDGAGCVARKCLTGCLCRLQPKLSMAKCRRNVENFLDACRKIGVAEVRGPTSDPGLLSPTGAF